MLSRIFGLAYFRQGTYNKPGRILTTQQANNSPDWQAFCARAMTSQEYRLHIPFSKLNVTQQPEQLQKRAISHIKAHKISNSLV